MNQPGMVDPEPLVSVVIPAYNAGRFLGEALASVRAQTYRRLEIIVCDDASTDDTDAIAQSSGDSRVRYLRNDATLGGYGAMNRGVRESRGDYVAIYHADDVYDANIVAREVAYLREHGDAGAVFCLDRFLDESGREYTRLQLPDMLRSTTSFDAASLAEGLLRFENTFLRTPSVMFRRQAFDSVGGFDQERFGIAADLDMWARLSLEWRIGLVHEYLMGYRHYTAQWSKRYERLRVEQDLYFAVMDRHLSRPGVRALVSEEALTCYRVSRVQDEAERAANAYILGDRRRAVALLNSSLVRPLLRTPQRARVARVLGLRTLVRIAAATGTAAPVRALVHFARFRRLPGGDLAPPPSSVAQSLRDNAPAGVAGAPNGRVGASAGTPTDTAVRREPRVRVYVDPYTPHFYGNELFNARSRFNRDNSLRPWFRLRERLAAHDIPVATADYLLDSSARRSNSSDVDVYVSFGVRSNYSALSQRDDVLLNAFYLFEVIVVEPDLYYATPELARHFRTVYSWTSADQLRPFVPDVPALAPFRIPMAYDQVLEPHWSRTDRRGIILVNSNKRAALSDGELYTERLRALKYFARNDAIDLWGRLWENGLGELEPEFGDAIRRSWRGPLDDKYEAMSRYRFAICYENMVLDGWITEKLFDCLTAGVVPIYLGAPDIADVVDPACYIDFRRFGSYEELDRYLNALSDADYERFRVAGRDYLRSEQFRQFTPDAFADRFIGDVEAHLRERGLGHLWR